MLMAGQREWVTSEVSSRSPLVGRGRHTSGRFRASALPRYSGRPADVLPAVLSVNRTLVRPDKRRRPLSGEYIADFYAQLRLELPPHHPPGEQNLVPFLRPDVPSRTP